MALILLPARTPTRRRVELGAHDDASRRPGVPLEVARQHQRRHAALQGLRSLEEFAADAVENRVDARHADRLMAPVSRRTAHPVATGAQVAAWTPPFDWSSDVALPVRGRTLRHGFSRRTTCRNKMIDLLLYYKYNLLTSYRRRYTNGTTRSDTPTSKSTASTSPPSTPSTGTPLSPTRTAATANRAGLPTARSAAGCMS